MPGTNNYSRIDGLELEQNGQKHPQATEDVDPAITGTQTPVAEHQAAASSYDDIISSIQSEMEKQENKRKEEQKVDAVVAAINGIGDIGRAIGNIYATTNNVPSAFDPKETASAKYAERAAKAREGYKKDRKEMMLYLDRYKKANNDFKYTQEKMRLAHDKWEKEEARKEALNKARVESYNAQTNYREAMANKNYNQAKMYEEQVLFLHAKQKYLELGYNLKQAESQAHIEAEEALAEKRRREAYGTTISTTIERDRDGSETGRTVTRKPNGGGTDGGGGGGKKKKNPMS